MAPLLPLYVALPNLESSSECVDVDNIVTVTDSQQRVVLKHEC